MKITIEGGEKKVNLLRKELRLRLSRDKLILKVEESGPVKEVKKRIKKT